MDVNLRTKLKTLPNEPGVYFHKSKTGEIIYVGKAANLRNRVRQYFQDSRTRDIKTDVLVNEIADTDWMVVESEIDALFLESEMIKRYKPRYNILLRDDKSQLYVRLNMRDPYPYLSFTRQPMDDSADYFGPYYNGWAVRKALRYLRRAFPYSTHQVMPKRVCLQYHIGLCPGVEEQKISSSDYKKRLRKLILYLKGQREQVVKQLETEMAQMADSQRFEDAAKLRNQIRNLKELQRKILFSDKEFLDISKDQALSGLQQLISLKGVPKRIEGYDISHMQGSNNVASMVVATNGVADKSEYRKFKLRVPGNDDFAHMHEVISRRFSGEHSSWSKPDLLLIDGGKGQLSAAMKALQEKGVDIPAIGLAKRLEEIVVHKSILPVIPNLIGNPVKKEFILTGSPIVAGDDVAQNGYILETDDFYVIRLPHDSHIVKLLQRIRDESHRFAVSYHTVLKRQGQTASLLEEIPGIGPTTRKKLIRTFGSLRAVKLATPEQLVEAIGESRAALVINSLNLKSRTP
ncbi:MAG TPA: excinuclease ABC subunit UvrC [Patescibacteria group bacterium]|jgi:excinuclease ABC subunit C|nr:excinuclease ABC subunit UvrC [Patescibacteria group bacterium]